jgi:hypothetical protein
MALPPDFDIFALPSTPGSRPAFGIRGTRLGQDRPSGGCVDAAGDLIRLLDEGRLILSHRNHRRLEGSYVGRLRRRIAQEPRRYVAPEAARANLVLDRRIAFQPGDGDEIQVKKRQIGKRGQVRLQADRGLRRIDPHRKIVERHFDHVGPDLGRIMGIVRQGLHVGQKQILLVAVLKPETVKE